MSPRGRVIRDPLILKILLNDPRAAWLWLVVRVWLGYSWLDAALKKVGDPAWMENGNAVGNFWQSVVEVSQDGRSSIAFDWYRGFIQFLLDSGAQTWFGPLVAYAELTVGVLLVLGAFTGIAAFAGGFMNWNFMMAGSASSNPMLFVAAMSIVMAWKVAGYIGLDYYLLPWIGTPWNGQNSDKLRF